MFFDKNKKVLFVAEMDDHLKPLLQEETNLNPHNRLIVSNLDALIADPYSDGMRSIIIAIHQEKVEEILIVGTTEDHEDKVDVQTVIERMKENKRIKANMKTIDHLFQYNIPKFPYDSVRDWLEGNKSAGVDVENIANLIRQHPLVPSNVLVRGLVLNKERRELAGAAFV